MNPLILDFPSVGLKVVNSHLVIESTDYLTKKKRTIGIYKAHNLPFDCLVCPKYGYITFDVLDFLNANNVLLLWVNHEGLKYSFVPSHFFNSLPKIAQFRTFDNETKRNLIARAFVQAKIEKQFSVLCKMNERNKVKHEDFITRRDLALQSLNLMNANVETIEGNFANYYWHEYALCFDSCWDFTQRGNSEAKNNKNATDAINCLLNYGYGILFGILRKCLVGVGFDLGIPFLHKVNKNYDALISDFAELYRPTIDFLIWALIEQGNIKPKDFRVVKKLNYSMIVEPQARNLFIEKVCNEIDSFRVLEQRRILMRYLEGRTKEIHFEWGLNLLIE